MLAGLTDGAIDAGRNDGATEEAGRALGCLPEGATEGGGILAGWAVPAERPPEEGAEDGRRTLAGLTGARDGATVGALADGVEDTALVAGMKEGTCEGTA
jgi:hypothetical protein